MHKVLSLAEFPSELYAGDSLAVRFISDDFSRSDDWSLTLTLNGPEKIEVEGEEDPDNEDAFLILVPSVDSADWLPGRYSWTILLTDADDDRHTDTSGSLRVLPDPATQTGATDQRSFARQALDAIEAALVSRGAESSWSVFGRSYTFESREQLLKTREYYRREVQVEEEAERRSQGKRSRGTAWFRF